MTYQQSDYDSPRSMTIEEIEALVARDRAYEPTPEHLAQRTGFLWKAEFPVTSPSRLSAVQSAPWPEGLGAVVVTGLLVPGGAQIMAYDLAPESERDGLMLRGVGAMIGVLGLAAVGANQLPGGGGQGQPARRGNPGVAYGCLGGAAILHLWSIADAVKTVTRGRTFTVVPERGGASAQVSMRF